MRIAVDKGRATRPDLELGICGEHGGDPASIAKCERIGLDYVSCSPFRVPVARLAAAQAALGQRRRARQVTRPHGVRRVEPGDLSPEDWNQADAARREPRAGRATAGPSGASLASVRLLIVVMGRVRRAVRRAEPAERPDAVAVTARRPPQLPPVPAAALPGRDRGPSPGEIAHRCARSCASSGTRPCCSARRSARPRAARGPAVRRRPDRRTTR